MTGDEAEIKSDSLPKATETDVSAAAAPKKSRFRYGDPTHPNAPCFNLKARGSMTTLGVYPEFDSLGNGIGLHLAMHAIQVRAHVDVG